MGGPDSGQVRKTTGRNIGIIGKLALTDTEKKTLRHIGRCIALLDHTLVYVPAKGTADQLREGVEQEAGNTLLLETGVLDKADHTLVYPDKRLLSRLLAKYPTLQNQDNVTIIHEVDLQKWADAINTLLEERNITPPPR